MTTLEELERRVQRLEDVEAIKAMKGRYARFCDDQYDPEGIASLFVENGVWDGGSFGTYQGHDAIKEFFRGVSGAITFAQHNSISPVIDVADDGLTATGKWYILMPCTMARPDGSGQFDAVVLIGHYDEDYVKVGGEWKFQHLRVTLHHISDLDKGWVVQPMRS